MICSPVVLFFPLVLHTISDYWYSMGDPSAMASLQENLIHNDGSYPEEAAPRAMAASYSFPKIELHLHLDGSVRFETLLELSKQKKIPLGNATTVEEVKKLLITTTPANLSRVLQAFEIFLPVIKDDTAAMERVAYELCEDQASQGVIYFEARYAPHLLRTPNSTVTSREIVEAVSRGLARGKKDFGVESRQILCMICGMPEHNHELLELVKTCKDLGVVAIDVAGSAHGADEKYEESVVAVFKEAYALGIHRTAHAGESGGAKEVLNAINEMHAERIGHGYRILRDEEAYRSNFIDKRRAHLEACPYSSIMTGAVIPDWPRHPIARWAQDDVDFSISRDDPTCFDNTPDGELELVRTKIGLTLHQLWKAQLNAAEACFAEDPYKSQLIAKIKAAEPPRE